MRKIGKTIPVYFTDEELELLERIDQARNHISRAGWMKQAAEEKLKNEKYAEIKQIDEIIKKN